jgi:type VI secretion system protein ImpA
LAPIAGLSGQGYDGTLMQPLRQLSLFERGDGSKFSVWQYQASMELAGIADPKRRAQRLDAGTLPFETVEKEAQAVPAGHWIAYRNSVNAAFGAWVALGTALDVKAGTFSPSVSRVHDMLQLLLDTCNRFAPRDDANSPPEEPLPEGAPAKSPAPGGAISGQVISGREQALRQVLEIAAWFRQNEPQSPLAYTLTEAVRRGRMTWPELIEELVSDEATRAGLMTSLGINPTSLKS